MKKSYYFYTTFGLLILLGLIISGYIFGWTVPSTTPPGGNLAPPINTGSTNQAKTGYLAVGTSTTPTYPLEVGNQLRVWGQLISKVASGTAPFVIDSPTKVTNLNADTLDGYDSSDLLGGSVEVPAEVDNYYYNGGNPYYCKKKTVDSFGGVTIININNNKQCDTGKYCWNGECVIGQPTYYCDSDGDGYVSSYKVASCLSPQPSAGTDCDDSCSTCYPGSPYSTLSPDGLDQDCDGQVDESPVYLLFDTYYNYNGNLGGRAGADAKCDGDPDKPASCASSAWAFISVNADDEIQDMPTTKGVNTSYPWYFRDGSATPSLAANNWADLLDGSVINTPQSGGLDGNYWTGSYYTGAMATYGNCNGFVDSGTTVQGVYGNISRSDSGWLNAATNPYYYCNYVYDVLCACMQGFQ